MTKRNRFSLTLLAVAASCSLISGQTIAAQSTAPDAGRTQTSAEKRSFETVSIHQNAPGNASNGIWKVFPNALRVRNQVVWATVMLAYSPLPSEYWRNDQLVGVPFWPDGYDIDAIVDQPTIAAWKNMTDAQRLEDARLMLRTVLTERYRLSLHSETKEISTYALVVAKHGSKLNPAKPFSAPPAGFFAFDDGGGWSGIPPHNVSLYSASTASLAKFLSRTSPYPIEDRTGLTGRYDMTLTLRQNLNPDPSDPQAASKFDLDSLGLKLIPAKSRTVILVVDHIEKPSAN